MKKNFLLCGFLSLIVVLALFSTSYGEEISNDTGGGGRDAGIQFSFHDEGCPECIPSLSWGYPYYDPMMHILADYFTIRNVSDVDLELPIHAVLEILEPSSVQALNTDGGGTQAPTAYWEYSVTNNDGMTPGVSGTTLPPGEQIARIWEFSTPYSSGCNFWIDLRCGVGRGEVRLERSFFSTDRAASYNVESRPGEIFDHDDGSVEMHVGSDEGVVVLANRFTVLSSMDLDSISFYASGAAAGDPVEVIVYEDASGEAAAPEALMEVWRKPLVLGSGGFQTVSAADCPTINAEAVPGAAFFVAVVNTGPRNYTLGIDLSGPKAGASFISIDGAFTFAPISSMPIIDGNAMIRVQGTHGTTCFIGALMK